MYIMLHKEWKLLNSEWTRIYFFQNEIYLVTLIIRLQWLCSLQLSIHLFSKVTLIPQFWPGACLYHKRALDLLKNNLHWKLTVLWAQDRGSQSLFKFKTNFWGLPARTTVSRGAMKQCQHETSTWNKWDSRTIGTIFWRNLWDHCNSKCLLVMSA